jgi:hypothetical protein
MKKITVCFLTLTLFAWLSVAASSAAPRSDFALYDQESTVADVSVQCGATNSQGNSLKRTAFTVHITMTNREDLGGVGGFVHVEYQDGDFVEYAIPANTTLQITLSGGGTPGVDQIIKVTGTGGAVLVGQMSLLTETGKPHRDLFGQTTPARLFCSTEPAPPPPPPPAP